MYLLLIVCLVGVLLLFVGMRYGGSWLILCAIAGYLIIPGFYEGGCDGGLCTLWILVMPPIWFGIGIVLLIVKMSHKRKDRAKVIDKQNSAEELQTDVK
jgi:hypothetical protein